MLVEFERSGGYDRRTFKAAASNELWKGVALWGYFLNVKAHFALTVQEKCIGRAV